MKKLLSSLLTVTFLSMLFVVSAGNKAKAQDVTVSYQEFYDELSPYGQWVYDPEYGNVWVPNEDGDFRPYSSRGHWVMTEYGNTWVTNDPWGWAVYHYGRWTYNSYYGWIWVPGYEWAPAWVSWRYGGGYCGWAPLSPGYSVGSSYGCPENWWVFVGPQYLYRDDYYRYWRGPRYNRECIRRTNFYSNVYTDNYTHVRYNYGPRASAIQQYTHQPVQVFRVNRSTRPGAQPIQQNTVSIYRPTINRNTASTARPNNVIQAPRNIGRPEAHSEAVAGRQPAFRQEVIRHNEANPRNTGVVGPRNNNQPRIDVRGNQQVDPRSSQPRFDNRGDVRGNQQADPRNGQPRFDNRGDVRGNQQVDPRNQPRFDNRGDVRGNQQADPRNSQPRIDNRGDVRGNEQVDPRNQPRYDVRSNPQIEPRNEVRNVPQPLPRNEVRDNPIEPRNEVRNIPQPQPRIEVRNNPQVQPDRPAPQRFEPQERRNEPRNVPQAQPERPAPPRFEPQERRNEPRNVPQAQPERPRFEPQREQPRSNPQPQSRPEPQRFNPPPPSRPQPAAPAPQPRNNAPAREEGRGGRR